MRTTGQLPRPVATVDVCVPVHNEQAVLDTSVRRLVAYLRTRSFTATVTIADNASTDATWAIAQRLADQLPEVRAVHVTEKGRGRALRHVWSRSESPVLAYTDVDLSTDLSALPPLIAPLMSGHSDLAIGNRLSRSSRVSRGPKREVVSRCYNLLLHVALRTGVRDAQCGFKAIGAAPARALLPHVVDEEWFFDTELLVAAERCGLRIHEVAVDWVDDEDSRVELLPTAIADLRGVARLMADGVSGRLPVAGIRHELGLAESVPAPDLVAQAVRFAAIGVTSTVAYLLLYVALRPALGSQVANALGLLVTAVANTAANRRWTFAIRSSEGRVRDQAQGFVVFAVSLLLSSGGLALLHTTDPDASRGVDVTVLVAANVLATLVRFVLLRRWVFRRAGATPAGSAPQSPGRRLAAVDDGYPDDQPARRVS